MHFGAGSENRTRATRSEAWDSTTKLYPHQHIHYTTNITNMQIKIKISHPSKQTLYHSNNLANHYQKKKQISI